MTDVDTLTLPALSNKEWRMLCSAFCETVSIPASDARGTLITAIVADNALDELPEGHSAWAAVLGSFWALSESEARAALSVNNALWQSGRCLWLEIAPGEVWENGDADARAGAET